MGLIKKKRKITYNFMDYCQKQITIYQNLQDTDTDPVNNKLYETMVGRYEMMIAEFKRYNKERELMERKNLSDEG